MQVFLIIILNLLETNRYKFAKKRLGGGSQGYWGRDGLGFLPHEGGTVLETGRATSLVQGIAIREVRAGESLSQIAMETYGAQSEKYIEWVKKHNPQIVNPDIILAGQNIVLPMYGNKKESQ